MSRVLAPGIPTWSSSSAARVFACVAAHPEMRLERLRDLAPDREHRVQARHRILEDHRDLLAAHRAQLRVGELDQVAALEHRACRRRRVPARGRIPSSASDVTLLPQPDSPTIPSVSPRAIVERDAVDGVDRAPRGPELDPQAVDGEQRLSHGRAASGRAPRGARRRSG